MSAQRDPPARGHRAAGGRLSFDALALRPAEVERLRIPMAAAGRLIEARPRALAVLVEFELLADEDGVGRLRSEWTLLSAGGRRTTPETAFAEPRHWADCWAVQRFPWQFFLIELLARGLLERHGRRPDLDRLMAELARGGLLVWPEATLLLDDATPLLTQAEQPAGMLRPLIGASHRENPSTAAEIMARLVTIFPGLAAEIDAPYGVMF